MIDSKQLRNLIIKPALDSLQLYSSHAEELLVFTCATESLGGHYLAQVKGPALGIYQMEPATYSDLWQRFITRNSKISTLLGMHFNVNLIPPEERLIYDLRYATAMSRLFYFRIPEKLPDASNIDEIWAYYKKYYNTEKGKAKKGESIDKYQHFISQ
jgi:hypothetical protein